MSSDGGFIDRFRNRLTALGDHHDCVVVVGGSALTDLATPTSDVDVMVVGPAELNRTVVQAARGGRPVDVEVRDPRWLVDIGRQLERFSPRANGGSSPFSLFDLRFVARLLLGRAVVGVPPEHLREPVRIALADYFATWWTSTYQDLLGLYLAQRPDEALSLAGELAQRACTLALLQLGLADPAPKWALRKCLLHDRLAAAAGRMHVALRCSEPNQRWLREVLLAANGVVAASRYRAEMIVPSKSDERLVQWCLVGRPGLDLLLDGVTGRLRVYNSAVLAGYLGGVMANGR